YSPENRDWNENRVANRLLALSRWVTSVVSPSEAAVNHFDVGDSIMVAVLEGNPGAIHTLYEFEVKLAALLQSMPAFTGRSIPDMPASQPSCPPDYIDELATCRRDASSIPKPSYTRTGSFPGVCPAGAELDWDGFCYNQCAPGYYPVVTTCVQSCP